MISSPTAQPTPTKEQRPYEAHGGALELWRSTDKEILMDGPAGTGKTRAILEKVYAIARKYPSVRILLIRKSRESMTDSVLVTFEEKVIPQGDPILLGAIGRPITRDKRKRYRFANGSEIVVGGLDRASKIMSSEYDIVAVFEATELFEDDWESLISRLRNFQMPYQQIMGDCNPTYPTHWLNMRFNRGGKRILSRHKDNPRYYNETTSSWTAQGTSYLEGLSGLTGARKLRLLDGKWAKEEGLVYDGFDTAVNVIEPYYLPPEWRRIRSVDFGYVNPCVCQWWAIAPSGQMILYREYYRTKFLNSPDFVAKIHELTGNERIETTVVDWDAQERAQLEAAGIHLTLAYKAVSLGIQAVKRRIADMGNGEPGLVYFQGFQIFVDRDLQTDGKPTSVLEEKDSYSWPETVREKEEPVKQNDHGSDAERYAVCYIDNIAAKGAGIRWVIQPQISSDDSSQEVLQAHEESTVNE